MNIKALILVCATITCSVFQLNAQDRFSIGPRVGVNFSNVSNVDDSESLTGLSLGLTSTYSINESTGLTFDLLYSGEGAKFGNSEIKLSYLQIPILFNVFFGELGSAFRPKVYVGVAPSFLLSAKINDTDQKDLYNSLNLPLVGGLGFNTRIAGRVWLNADLRAYLGLSDIRADENQEGDRVGLNTIQPSIGIAYGLSKLD